MNPEATKTGFIHRMVGGSWKRSLQIVGQFLNLGRLVESLVFKLFSMNANAPTLFVNVHTDVNVLTREIKFATFIHGKPPLGMFLLWQTKYTMQG